MTIRRMDNVLIVADDLEAAKAFFIELGLKSSMRRPCEEMTAIAEQLIHHLLSEFGLSPFFADT